MHKDELFDRYVDNLRSYLRTLDDRKPSLIKQNDTMEDYLNDGSDAVYMLRDLTQKALEAFIHEVTKEQ